MVVALRGNGMEESKVSHLMWGAGPRAWPSKDALHPYVV